MGKNKPNPRYNVISCRASVKELNEIHAILGNVPLSDFVREALQEKVRREQQQRMDHALSQRL